MGEALRRTASSTNIVDRLDFSCALFDAEGNLIANAPHIPVHLGAMGESVRAVLLRHPKLRPGDSFVTNDPSLGGSHLPDITVVTPGFSSDGRLLFVTASRGHHADVGGVTPGSMPPFSTSLAEEGIVLSAEPLVSEGRLKETEILAHLMSGPHPARKVGENMADLQAQLAANQLGASLLQKLIARISEAEVLSAMGAVRSLASRWMRDAIKQLPPGPFLYTDALDDGTRIRVEVRRAGEELVIDFSGTDQATHANQNAPRAVTIACVLYVLRTLLSRPLPLNEGCLEPVELRIPTGSLLDPPQGRAVAAGNVETSQRIVDVLLGALNLAAASQGTMNNLSFGNAEFGYYETIAGGAGAGPTFSGAHAVHTHMTNTRITDPETLESTCPVRLVRFCVRRGSGGLGRNRGGDGVVREIEALAPLQISLLTNRRTSAPFGLEGGGAGKPGKNWIAGKEVSSCASARLEPGQTLRIETPGGGGYGATE
jgi:5-oxoprolinase (ATP-hydrolysing)